MAQENQGGKRCPITGLIDCRQRTCELHYMDAPLKLPPTEAERVKIVISSEYVAPGLWNSDEGAEYAIAMDDDRGGLVWHRSNDWVLYALHHGYNRVAKILEA